MFRLNVFSVWWNALAKKNGKLKFKNQREAADFVRETYNKNGGPNAKLIEMKRQYEETISASERNEQVGDITGKHQAV